MNRLYEAISILLLIGGGTLVLPQAQTGNVTLPQDKGPDKIDVSSYPAEIQSAYKLFTSKCSKCHTIARPLNTTMTREEWERYVKRMMHKPNSGINEKQGKQIFDFVIYDEVNRKAKNPKAFFRALTDEEIAKLRSGK